MNKALFFLRLSSIVLLASCVSVPPKVIGDMGMPSMSGQWASGYFVVAPRETVLVVIGVSGRHHSRWDNEISEAEIEAAREDAARKVAMFHGMKVTVEAFNQAGASVFDYIMDLQVSLELNTDHTRFIEQLTFDPAQDVFVFQGGTFVRFKYAASVPSVNRAGTADSNGRPAWIDSRNLPKVEGHTLAVGFSQNQAQLKDTIMKSAEATAARLITSTTTSIATSVDDVVGQGSMTYIHNKSEGNLTGFRVLEFWIDPANMSVYTLGIARSN